MDLIALILPYIHSDEDICKFCILLYELCSLLQKLPLIFFIIKKKDRVKKKSFCKKKFLIGPVLEEVRFFRVVLRMKK